jgi:hypothetical protein
LLMFLMKSFMYLNFNNNAYICTDKMPI